MTYNVFGGTLNLAVSIYLPIFWACVSGTPNFIIINPYFWPGVTGLGSPKFWRRRWLLQAFDVGVCNGNQRPNSIETLVTDTVRGEPCCYTGSDVRLIRCYW